MRLKENNLELSFHRKCAKLLIQSLLSIESFIDMINSEFYGNIIFRIKISGNFCSLSMVFISFTHCYLFRVYYERCLTVIQYIFGQ